MKYKVLLLVVLIGIIFFARCSDEDVIPRRDSGSVTLKIITDKWSSWSPPGSAHEIDSVVVDVTNGEEFGPTDFTGSSGERPFKLLRVIDNTTIEVQFIERLVVVGEPISKPSEQNPKIISGERVCFRTRTYDSGTDICLEIID